MLLKLNLLATNPCLYKNYDLMICSIKYQLSFIPAKLLKIGSAKLF